MQDIVGKINSEESMGLVDGPGIRYVVFLQGCKLRCKYCHNPETWDINGTCYLTTPKDLVAKISRFKAYFGEDGGVTFSGGEPLLQPEFLSECLKLCKDNGINTCLDTAGVGFGNYEGVLQNVDLVMLDVKAVDEKEYKDLVGVNNTEFLKFVDICKKLNKNLWLRQVIVPGINDDLEHMDKLLNFAKQLKNVTKIELLPYKTIGVMKYKKLNIPYRLKNVPEMDEEKCKQLQKYINKNA